MAIRHDEKKPGFMWYTWQKTKALAKTVSDKSTRSDALNTARNAAISLGSGAGGIYIASSMTFLGLPSLICLAGIAGCALFGYHTLNGLTSLKRSTPYLRSIRENEEKWLKKKSAPALGARLKALCLKSCATTGYMIAAAATAVGGIGILEYAGIPVAGALTPLLTTVGLPVVIGGAAAALAIGATAGILCWKGANKTLGKVSAEQKPAAAQPQALPFHKRMELEEAQPSNSNDNTVSFNETAAPQVKTKELSELRRKAAEARAASRKAGKIKPQF